MAERVGYDPGAERRSWTNARGLLIAFLIVAAFVGWNRDFGVFMIEFLALPIIIIAGLCVSLRVLPSRPLWQSIMAEVGALAAIAFVAIAANRVHDPVVGVLWTAVHPQTVYRTIDRDGVVAHLESWGAAFTADNESYLVSDTHDALSSPAGSADWQRRHGAKCPIVDPDRIWPKLYVAVTVDCLL